MIAFGGRRWASASLLVALGLVAPVIGSAGCGAEPSGSGAPDTALLTHVVDLARADAEGLAFMERAAEAHEAADAAHAAGAPGQALKSLDAVWQRAPLTFAGPNAGVVEIVVFELLARRAELAVEIADPGLARDMLETLRPLLSPAQSLPRDRASARALVGLGDVARLAGDDRLAVESYARAIDLMAILMEDVKP
jgi:hypothetical protein